jgi:hypothetical protein
MAHCLPPLLLLAGCVTTYEDAPLLGLPNGAPAPAPAAASVTIPFGGEADQGGEIASFYRSVLQRMQEAAQDRDLSQLETLLASYERSDLPLSIQQHVAGYRSVAIGLRFLDQAPRQSRLVLAPAAPDNATPSAAPPLGQALQLELQLAAGAEPVRIGGRDADDPVGFAVAVTVDDSFVDGGSRSSSTTEFVWLPADFELAADAVLRLPVAVDLMGGDAVRRTILVRVDVMPGYVSVADRRVPIRRTRLAAASFTQWPSGYEALAKAPLAELQAALRAFEPRQFARAWLAALQTGPDERPAAVALLIDQVRFGRSDQAQVAMAALRAITGAEIPVGDRDGWLAWWQQRR